MNQRAHRALAAPRIDVRPPGVIRRPILTPDWSAPLGPDRFRLPN